MDEQMILIIGSPDSGKSSLAESITVELSEGKTSAYIATMIPFGKDGENRINRHKKLREGKNFITFEEAYCVKDVVSKIKEKGIETALLECVSNLVGNVMHKPENYTANSEEAECDKALVDIIVKDINELSNGVKNLVLVANYFELNDEYDEDTKRYVSINNAVNERLIENSDTCYLNEGIAEKVPGIKIEKAPGTTIEKSSDIVFDKTIIATGTANEKLIKKEKGWILYENN